MKGIFVLLVSLCIGLVCGFIVPSGIPEFIDEEAAILAENDSTKQDEMKLSTIEPGFVVFPDDGGMMNDNKLNIEKVREIGDNALYENYLDKENNLSERSYVYINQKFKPPARKGFHRSKQVKNNTPGKNMFIPPTIRKKTTDKRPSTKFAYGFFEPSLNELLYKDLNDNYILSNNKCDDCSKGKKMHGLQNKKYDKLKTNNKGIEDELNYIEFLKPPYVRTLNKNNIIKNEYPNMNGLTSNRVQKQNHSDKKYLNSELSSTAMKKEIGTFRRMHTEKKPILDNSEIPNKEDNLIFDENTDQTYRPLQDTPEERRELDRIQKNTYGEHITNEKVNINYNACNYKDCLQSNKKIQRKANKSNCKCRVNQHTKGNNIQQKLLGKEKMRTNKTTGINNSDVRRLLDDTDYDNILIESASRSGDEELMKTINKLNYTLQMYR